MRFLYIVILLLLNIPVVLCQINMLPDTLEKSMKVSSHSGDVIVTYSDIKGEMEQFISPKGKDGQNVEFSLPKVNSREEMLKIANRVFSEQEINELKKAHCYVKMISTCSGDVISASFIFLKGDPDIDLDKLIEFSVGIKNNISFSINFAQEVTNFGYVGLAYPLFE